MKAGNEAQRSDRIEPAQRFLSPYKQHSAALRSRLALKACDVVFDAFIVVVEDDVFVGGQMDGIELIFGDVDTDY